MSRFPGRAAGNHRQIMDESCGVKYAIPKDRTSSSEGRWTLAFLTERLCTMGRVVFRPAVSPRPHSPASPHTSPLRGTRRRPRLMQFAGAPPSAAASPSSPSLWPASRHTVTSDPQAVLALKSPLSVRIGERRQTRSARRALGPEADLRSFLRSHTPRRCMAWRKRRTVRSTTCLQSAA